MARHLEYLLLAMLAITGTLPCEAQDKTSTKAGTQESPKSRPETISWRMVGRVMTPQGKPLDGVDVQINIDTDGNGQIFQSVKTNLQGEFQGDLVLDFPHGPRLFATFTAEKTGFTEGQEALDLSNNVKPAPVYIVMRDSKEKPDQIPLSALIKKLGPRLRDDAVNRFADEKKRDEFARGCEALINSNKPVEAIRLLKNSLGYKPDCIECQVLLSLGFIGTGSWSSANQQLELATKANDSNNPRRPEPALVMGMLNSWQGRNGQAAQSYIHALEADPQNMFALQELGRMLVIQEKWEAADQYLDKAIKAGADENARLLRIRALLELGDVAEAAGEADRYSAGRKIKDLPPDARVILMDVQNRMTLLASKQVSSVIVQSTEELIHLLPDLQGLRAAADQSMLEEVLKNTGEGVDTFFRNFQNTASLEKVRQERLGKDGKPKVSLNQEFNYLMLANPQRPSLGIEEHRSKADGQDSELKGLHEGLMLTSGFASASSVFHPVNRSGADFRYLGQQTLGDHQVHVVAFAQKPQTAKMVTSFVTDSGTVHILTQGFAWIDLATFHILRLHTTLLNPLPSVRLQNQTTEIQFQQVDFNEGKTRLWLPLEVKVMVDWKGRILRNQHSYSDFKLFNVEAKEDKKTLKSAKQQ